MSSRNSEEKVGQSEKSADLEKGHVKDGKSRRFNPFSSATPPPPAKESIDDADIIPEVSANMFSIITFEWITPLLRLGYRRPLEAPDLYKLQDDRSAAVIGNRILESWERRQKEADEFNARLASGEISPGLRKKVWWTVRGGRAEREKEWREKTGRKSPSLALAMNDSIKWWFWSGGVLKILGDTAQVTTPLLVKALINFATDSYRGHLTGGPVPGIGKGIGLAIGLLALNIFGSLCLHHFFYRATSAGVLIRGGLINAIYQRSLRLTARSRSKLPNGLIMNHISTDVSRIDFCAGFFHMSWTAPIQMIICLILLLINLGPSALAGFGFFILITPIQTYCMRQMFKLRAKSMGWTDKRAKLLQELLNGMKVIKFFAWEVPFLNRITLFRGNEMKYIRTLLLVRSAINAVAMSLPALASVLAFVTYSLSGHDLDPADVFASLTLFNLLRLPLMMLPVSLSSIADAANATNRLYPVFEAEILEETRIVDQVLSNAIEVKAATWSWDAPPPEPEDKKALKKAAAAAKKHGSRPATANEEKPAEFEPFKVKNVSMNIPRGQLVAVVGRVGSGKSSLLQGLIGEMRRTEGSVKFGGSVGYCPQSAWIQNATIRENVTFGRPFEEDRYWKAIRDSCLESDLEMLPYGDMTEVGEKGISLSGGQKQRLNICRAIYCNTDIQIFDDPLSALDAHVGKAVFRNVLLNAPAGKTRVLVTHALHFLPQVDYIYVVSDGRIVEEGSYADLMASGNEFSVFINEFGSKEEKKEEEEEEEKAVEKVVGGEDEAATEKKKKAAAVAGAAMMQAEERNTGAIDGSVYKEYIQAGKGEFIVPFLLVSLCLVQGATVMSSYWLVYWQEDKFRESQGFYMGIYAGLGVAQAFAMFLMGSTFAMLTFFASQMLHKGAIRRVMTAPMSFFETTPLGRIMNRFSKDIDTIDNLLGDAMRMLAATTSGIVGAIILISIVLPWFLIPVVVIMTIYVYAAYFYRSSAREFKRLDAILRSSLYAHFSESLSGLSTVRAYGESERFLKENETRIDIENRAYWLTVTNQRWLGVRLDFLGTLLTFAVALLAVGTRYSISPAQTGLVLSYILSIQQAFGWLVRQFAEVENNMNSVERIVYYAKEVEQEAAHELPESKPKGEWPARGGCRSRMSC
ncbi:hypothetical protein PM082_004826 [Marasmius tenuissimus]|nr:hypothetical protein PM082_004826 [Marasmius tenuissimus]